jgi:hypothetical protein
MKSIAAVSGIQTITVDLAKQVFQLACRCQFSNRAIPSIEARRFSQCLAQPQTRACRDGSLWVVSPFR